MDVARNDTGVFVPEDEDQTVEPMPDEIRRLLDELNRGVPDGRDPEDELRNRGIRLGP